MDKNEIAVIDIDPGTGGRREEAVIEDGNARVMNSGETYFYEGQTIDQNGEAVDPRPRPRFKKKSRVYVVKGDSPLKTLGIIAASALILGFILFVALPLGLLVTLIGVLLYYLRGR